MHVRKICLLRIINYQYVLIAIAVIIRVTYKITKSLNRLFNCISEPLTVTNVSNFLHSHWISACLLL